jgi:monovalent cation/proton antiporter MnhG/PhaG subunit
MTAWIADVLIVLGLIVMTLGVYGIVRFPDVYTQLHTSSKAAFLGVSILLVATALGGGPSMLARVVLIVTLLAMTTPSPPTPSPRRPTTSVSRCAPPARSTSAAPCRPRPPLHSGDATWKTALDPDPDQPSVTLFVDCPTELLTAAGRLPSRPPASPAPSRRRLQSRSRGAHFQARPRWRRPFQRPRPPTRQLPLGSVTLGGDPHSSSPPALPKTDAEFKTRLLTH